MKESPSSLRDEKVREVLDGLHAGARWDFLRLALAGPSLGLYRLVRRDLDTATLGRLLRNAFIPVSREQGKFLYLVARTVVARRVVEFGTSFGVSTIYLASAVRDNGGGLVIGTEIEASKREAALQNLTRAGLQEVVEVRPGDALQSLADVPSPVDLVLLDGWKTLYLRILQLLQPRLRRGSIVLADNIYTFRKSLRPYVQYMQSPSNGFASTTLSLGDGMEYSVFLG